MQVCALCKVRECAPPVTCFARNLLRLCASREYRVGGPGKILTLFYKALVQRLKLNYINNYINYYNYIAKIKKLNLVYLYINPDIHNMYSVRLIETLF